MREKLWREQKPLPVAGPACSPSYLQLWSFAMLPRVPEDWDGLWSQRLKSITPCDLAAIHGQWMHQSGILIPKVERDLGEESVAALEQVWNVDN